MPTTESTRWSSVQTSLSANFLKSLFLVTAILMSCGPRGLLRGPVDNRALNIERSVLECEPTRCLGYMKFRWKEPGSSDNELVSEVRFFTGVPAEPDSTDIPISGEALFLDFKAFRKLRECHLTGVGRFQPQTRSRSKVRFVFMFPSLRSVLLVEDTSLQFESGPIPKLDGLFAKAADLPCTEL